MMYTPAFLCPCQNHYLKAYIFDGRNALISTVAEPSKPNKLNKPNNLNELNKPKNPIAPTPSRVSGIQPISRPKRSQGA